jgi:hypothetical protein
MSAQGSTPRAPRGGRGQRPHVIAVVAAWLMTRAANKLGQSRARKDEEPKVVSPETVSTVVPIPLTGLGDMTSLEASASLSATGSLKGKEMSGDLLVQFLGDDRQQYRIDITGDLLGPIAAQVGGKITRFFRPKQVSVYVVEDGNYIVASGLTDVCIKTEDTAATDALSQLSPRTLMAILTDSDVAQGSLVGAESLDGTPIDHYVIDGPTFLAAAKASSHPTVQTFGRALRDARDADLYIHSETGYPVRYEGAFSGHHPIGLDGEFSVRLDLTKVGTDGTVTLPKACAKPITR